MRYSNRLKGSVTQSLVKTLLTEAGITVVPLGIEETIREVAELPQAQYLALQLPPSLRKLPDFFAANRDRTRSWLIEVKFRARWDDEVRAELGKTLLDQSLLWAPLYVVLFFGESPSRYYPDQPASWVRVARVFVEDGVLKFNFNGRSKNWGESTWTDFERIQDIFRELNARELWDAATLEATLKVSKGLSQL